MLGTGIQSFLFTKELLEQFLAQLWPEPVIATPNNCWAQLRGHYGEEPFSDLILCMATLFWRVRETACTDLLRVIQFGLE